MSQIDNNVIHRFKSNSKSNAAKELLLEDLKSVSKSVSAKEVCKYDEKCYRKNAQHLAEFSHPTK
jgi:hypothetical protein